MAMRAPRASGRRLVTDGVRYDQDECVQSSSCARRRLERPQLRLLWVAAMTARNLAPGGKGLSGKQCAEARKLLGWSRRELAEAALVAERTVDALEDGRPDPHPRAVENVRIALEAAGLDFRAGLQRGRAPQAEPQAPPVAARRRKVA